MIADPKMIPATTESEDDASAASVPRGHQWMLRATDLGDPGFRADYGIRLAYVAGAMYKGISSVDLVTAMGKAGLIGYYGTGGVSLDAVEVAIQRVKFKLDRGQSYGMNLLCNLERPEIEQRTVELLLRQNVRFAEAAAFLRITPSLVLFRLKGISRAEDGTVRVPNRILAKVSQPEIAALFMQPAPESIVRMLVETKQLAESEAELAKTVPMANEICVEADSGGHTDQGVAYVLLPAITALRVEAMGKHRYAQPIRIGAAGGIGTPHAAAAAFILGADFIVTGSINQCTVEAGTSDAVKDLLQEMKAHDTTYAPAGDMFELGAKVQVLRRGSFFAARANKLYELYQRYDALDSIDAKTRAQIQERYFRRSFAQVWEETREFYLRTNPQKVEEAERNPKKKMALVFRWYSIHSMRLALSGSEEQRVDYQVQCGPALGAFNQWVRHTPIEHWRNRTVADIAERLMGETASLLSLRFGQLGRLGSAAQSGARVAEDGRLGAATQFHRAEDGQS